MKAVWNGVVLAESDDTVVVEGNHYFPRGAMIPELFRPSSHRSHCPWKGTASYYDLLAGGAVNANAAWTYLDPTPAAARIRDHIAFWKGVQIVA